MAYELPLSPGTWSKRSSKIKPPTKLDLGREYQAVPIDQYADRWIFLNTTYWDFGDTSGTERERNPLKHSAIAQPISGQGYHPSPDRPLGHPLAHYSAVENLLIDYFIRGIAPFCSLSQNYNPYLSLVTPLALNIQQPHEPLRNILLAIAANQLRLQGDCRYERAAYIYKQKALHGLQNEIYDKKPSPGAVATITDGCTPSWTTHLRGGLQLMALLPQQSCESQILKKFFVLYFVAHDIMGRTGVEDPSTVERVDNSWLEDDDLEEIDVLMGCSRGLMTVINKISELATERSKIMKTRQLTSSESSTFNAARDDIEHTLQYLPQKLPPYAHHQSQYLAEVADLKRLAALLYLRERLGNPNVRTQPNPSLNRNQIAPGPVEISPAPCKTHLVKMIIDKIRKLPDSPTLLWPLYLVGNVGLDDEEHRRFVLDRLAGIQKIRNLGSVRRARMVVEYAYRAKDIDYPRGKVWGDDGPGIISLA
ncbi:hypothetical protein AJ79_08054 [Helicocarpus griseus UAMH5409]|uniref:Transcription factor domain-containing protein n=1 Tax=Helicocarpus griseus UAMH5409 TaxID=1447875 RepID=A0A2B7WWN0_9EURO|nr:hypothetical protein AJ79_08054 [Helicocarpus griseus UAMH5409]